MKSKSFRVAGAGLDVPSVAPKSEDHPGIDDDEHQTLSRVAARLLAFRERVHFQFDDEKTRNLCISGVYLVASVGLIVTLTGLPYLKYYWSVKETNNPLRRWISLQLLPDNALQTDAKPAYWIGLEEQYSSKEEQIPLYSRRVDQERLPHAGTEDSGDITSSRPGLSGRHCVAATETGSTDERPLTLELSFKKYEFSYKYLSYYFKLSDKKYPLLMVNAYTIYVKTDDSDPLIFAARPDQFTSLRTLLEEIGAEDPDDGPDLSSECAIWPPGVEPKPQLPSMVLPAPTVCPWETKKAHSFDD